MRSYSNPRGRITNPTSPVYLSVSMNVTGIAVQSMGGCILSPEYLSGPIYLFIPVTSLDIQEDVCFQGPVWVSYPAFPLF